MRNSYALMAVASLLFTVAGCGQAQKTAQAVPAPRFADGLLRLDRAPGEKGYWDMASAHSLVESGVQAAMDDTGRLINIADAAKVAPFQPWALALYQHRQNSNFADDPMKVCIGPGSPRQMMTPGGVRILQDRNYNRVYMIFGGGNRTWRVVYLDGRTPPDPEEVTGTFLGNGVGRWEGDTLVVDSIGFNTRFWFSNGGLPHTEALKLTEKLSRPTRDVLEYEVTVDDPRTYTRPWKAAWTLRWMPGDISEQFCEDGRD